MRIEVFPSSIFRHKPRWFGDDDDNDSDDGDDGYCIDRFMNFSRVDSTHRGSLVELAT
jgi:hypothetical protein